MRTDRELLELAAKAAGVVGEWCEIYRGILLTETNSNEGCEIWDPLTNDGDALRLAVKLGLTLRLNQFEEWTQAFVGDCYSRGATAVSEHIGRSTPGQTIEQATRRAIVRAAAEIGAAM